MTTITLGSWRYLVLRGVFSILFGMTALTVPGAMLTALVLLFGAYAFIDGLIAMLYALRISRSAKAWPLIFEGALGIVVGIVTLIWPSLTERLLIYFIAAWAIVTGVFEIAAMDWFRRSGLSGLWLAISGTLSVVLGVALFFLPAAGAMALTILFGSYALAFGVLICWLGLHLRRLSRDRVNTPEAAHA